MAIKLYPHNQKTYEKMTEMFNTSTRVGIVQPTGTGKSFLFLKWIEDHPNDFFTILSPSVEIFNQLQEYADSSEVPELLAHVQMISYQSLLKMTDEEVQAIQSDKLVLDEFHRTGAELWGPSLQRLLEANPNALVLGASATPVRYLDGNKDMASELFDRNLAVEMTLGEAVQRKILPTPAYIPVWYDLDGTMDRCEQNIALISDIKERKELEEKLNQLKRRLENSYGAEDIFRKRMPPTGKFIVFCRDREHLEEMVKTVPSWLAGVNLNIHCYVSITGQQDKDHQLQSFKLDHSKDAVKLLFTIDRLNEGLHVKGIDGVIMLRPTTSPIVYLQQMGRALAVKHNKPLIFDFVNNYHSVRIPISDGSSINVFEKEFRDAMEQTDDETAFRIFEDMVDFSEMFFELECLLYLSFQNKWSENFQLYCEFKQEFNCEPKQREHYRGIKLGKWVEYQRFAYKNGTLSEKNKQKLLEAGFVFGNTKEIEWQRKYELYKEFQQKYGRSPKRGDIYQGENIDMWGRKQRQAFKNGTLSDERLRLLLAINFVFDGRKRQLPGCSQTTS